MTNRRKMGWFSCPSCWACPVPGMAQINAANTATTDGKRHGTLRLRPLYMNVTMRLN